MSEVAELTKVVKQIKMEKKFWWKDIFASNNYVIKIAACVSSGKLKIICKRSLTYAATLMSGRAWACFLSCY